MRKGIMIAGYYGANNTGDEAILTGMIHALKKQGIQAEDITVLSRNPEQTKAMHQVNSIYIGRRFDGLWTIYNSLRKSKLFILGGGGLLQDHTARVVPYWLSRVIMALIARTPIMYYAQGIGPLRTEKAKNLVKKITNRVNLITVRDEPSLNLLKEIGVNKPTVEVTADPALGIEITSDGNRLLQRANQNPSKKIRIAISLRSWKGEEEYLPVLMEALKQLYEVQNAKENEEQLEFIFFPFQYGEDEQVSQQVISEINKWNKTSNQEDLPAKMITGEYTPEQMAAMLKEMDGVIAMRLHAIILSAISFVPSFGLVYDPKVRRFMERSQIDQYSWEIEEMAGQKERFIESVKQWYTERDTIKIQMQQPVKEMITTSLKNAELAKSFIEQRRS